MRVAMDRYDSHLDLKYPIFLRIFISNLRWASDGSHVSIDDNPTSTITSD